MIYPGLSKFPSHRKPVGSGVKSEPRRGAPGLRPGYPNQIEEIFPQFGIMKTQSIPFMPIAGPSSRPPQSQGTPSNGDSATYYVTSQRSSSNPTNKTDGSQNPVKKAKGPSASNISELEVMANDFHNADFNVAKVLAESIVFVGVVLLNWSLRLKSPQRIKAGMQIILTLVFFAVYPVYCSISIVLLCITYGYLKLAHNTLRN